MSRREWLAVAVGAFGGGLLSACVVALWEPNAGLWLATIIGAFFGLIGGALGQNFIEGCVIAGMCLIAAVFILSLPIPWPWLREVGVGWSIGTGVGCFAHGCLPEPGAAPDRGDTTASQE